MSSPIPDYPLRALNRELARHYAGRRVLVTGHTGFKGSWLCEWLLHLGAEVYGFGLEPPTDPSLFNLLSLSTRIHTHQIGDIRDLKTVKKSVKETKPDYVFHLAAQPLVRASYQNPIETWETNVIGSINVMEAVRESLDKCSVLMITTDKCYRNTESTFGYVESDPLGGNDPYSSSKAAAELSIHSWIHSFFTRLKGIKVASARAGNVIGGGDWALDRIVPDCVRALSQGISISVRNPASIRPFQHVLEPLSGYLWLAAILPLQNGNDYTEYQSFNFGPKAESHRSVSELVETMLNYWPGTWNNTADRTPLHESNVLRLNISKAQRLLGWQPKWSFIEAVEKTTFWYRKFNESATTSTMSIQSLVIRDIIDYANEF